MMFRKLALSALLVLGTLAATPSLAFTKVGNGDDGTDLEETELVTVGPFLESRTKAVDTLKRLNTSGIRGLGLLLPEVEKATLYQVKVDKNANLPSDQGNFHANFQGLVYARTLPEPHAPTRFFPAAAKLTSEQLVALHIHEGLHRALPESVRENEMVVAQITLAITSPEASRDSVERAVDKFVPAQDLRSLPPSGPGAFVEGPVHLVEEEHFRQPSNIGYGIKQFLTEREAPSLSDTYLISRMHVLHSDLYPFGGTNTPIGLGIEAAFLETERGLISGPLGLSAKLRVWSNRDFDIGVWGQASLNTLSHDELKNSPYGRDVYTLGLAMRKSMARWYVENFLSYSLGGEAKQKVALVDYTYNYGGVVNAKIRAGARLAHWNMGGFLEMHLADNYKVSSKRFDKEIGRYRIISMGPELSYLEDGFSASLYARLILNATNDANLSNLGNLMGPGVGQGAVGLSVAMFF